MEQFVTLVIFVAVLSFISIYADRHLQARKQEKGSEATESESKGIGSWFKSLRGKFSFKKSPNLVEQFQNWAKDAKLEKGLKTWLASLSDAEVKDLVRDLANFCAKLDLNLAWLGESVLDNEPDLKKLLETSVTSYCLTQWNAAKANEDVALLKIWLAVQQKPNKKKHQQLYKKLLANLIDKKVIKMSVAEYVDNSQKEQKKQAVDLVNKAAEENRKAFNAVLKDLLAASEEEVQEVESSNTAQSDKVAATASA